MPQEMKTRCLLLQVFPCPEPMLLLERGPDADLRPVISCYPLRMLGLVERQQVRQEADGTIVVVDRETQVAAVDYNEFGQLGICDYASYIGYAPARYSNDSLREMAKTQWHTYAYRAPVDWAAAKVWLIRGNECCERPDFTDAAGSDATT